MKGYIFSKPLPAAELEHLLREGTRLPDRFLKRGTHQPTLLLVDDEGNSLLSLCRLLRGGGHRIVVARRGTEGLAKLAELDVDVVLCAQRMPGMSGVEFLRQVKTLSPDIVRMVLSDCTDLHAIFDAVNDGTIHRFLAKPWDGDLLREHVADAFRRKDLADENRRLAMAVCNADLELAHVHERHLCMLARQRECIELEAMRAQTAHDLIENLPTASIGIDPEGTIVFVNRQARRLLPSASTLVGRDAADALPPDGLHAWQRPDGRHRAGRFGGQACLLSCTTMDDNGVPRGHLLSVITMPDSAEEPVT